MSDLKAAAWASRDAFTRTIVAFKLPVPTAART